MSAGAFAESCWTTDYSLAHCVGFDVVTADGRVGYVEDVRCGASGDVEALVVRVAARPQGTIEVPADAVEDVTAEHETVHVRLGTPRGGDRPR
jgi:hypothetical protein